MLSHFLLISPHQHHICISHSISLDWCAATMIPHLSLAATTIAFATSLLAQQSTMVDAFSTQHSPQHVHVLSDTNSRFVQPLHAQQVPVALHMARSYGPSDDIIIDQEQQDWEKKDAARVARQKVEFAELLADVLEIIEQNDMESMERLPGIMTRNMELILNIKGFEGVKMLRDAMAEAQKSNDDERIVQVEAAVNYILTFAEEFVDNALSLDETNKKLLGKIVKEITSGWNAGEGKRPGVEDEARLDKLFEREKENFTPGFLRHLEGECKRISSASRLTPESTKMLETLRMIQARTVEELGQELGEGAVVLGQLLGYDNRNERLAVLDAGLTVRGIAFARELADLTAEALEGFQRVPGGADPELIRIVSEIDERIQQFIKKAAPPP